VRVGEAELIVDRVKKNGGKVEYLLYGDEGHGLAKLKNRLDAYPKIAAFLDRHVGA
jgi:dipeptidyl aminopeptidase/acylaminoacyl peptidase